MPVGKEELLRKAIIAETQDFWVRQPGYPTPDWTWRSLRRLLRDDGAWTSYNGYSKDLVAEAGYHKWTLQSQDSHRLLVSNLYRDKLEVLPWLAEQVIRAIHEFIHRRGGQLPATFCVGKMVYLEDVLSIQAKMTPTDISRDFRQDMVAAALARRVDTMQVVGTFTNFLNIPDSVASDHLSMRLSPSDFIALAGSPTLHTLSNPSLGAVHPQPGLYSVGWGVAPTLEQAAASSVDSAFDFTAVDANNLDFSNIDFEGFDFGDFDFNDLDTIPEWAANTDNAPEAQQ
jgi:hypothetical protein